MESTLLYNARKRRVFIPDLAAADGESERFLHPPVTCTPQTNDVLYPYDVLYII